ncbi:MAG TPA: hypothetical protein VKE41_24430 [Roseiflexaceae bacterium]|nr:hypothetical protein [Roseiflexaceae bacterium]
MNEGSVAYDAWVAFCDDFSRAYGGRRASLSVREDHGSVVPIAEGLIFSGIGADLKDSENAVTIMLSDDAGAHMTHIVSDVRELFYQSDNALVPRLIINSAHDGTVLLQIDAA